MVVLRKCAELHCIIIMKCIFNQTKHEVGLYFSPNLSFQMLILLVSFMMSFPGPEVKIIQAKNSSAAKCDNELLPELSHLNSKFSPNHLP